PSSTPFPYTTLFRSQVARGTRRIGGDPRVEARVRVLHGADGAVEGHSAKRDRTVRAARPHGAIRTVEIGLGASAVAVERDRSLRSEERRVGKGWRAW